jgi:hypothetical protein
MHANECRAFASCQQAQSAAAANLINHGPATGYLAPFWHLKENG